MGYDGVELAGLYGMTPAQVKVILDEVGIPAISAHVPYQEMMTDPAGTLAQYKEIGCKYVAIPYLTEDVRHGTPAFPETLKNIAMLCEKAKEMGLTMLYHNHDFEFVTMETEKGTEYAFDYMYETVPAELLQTEIDTCWVNVAGEVPADYVRKYAGRCPVVHLKDFYKEGEALNMYELIGLEKKAEKKGIFEFRPVGYGLQDMPAIVKAAEESGAEWVIVEQDMSVGRTPMEAVKMSIEYLKG
ncbi:MAG: sugar phosphate isomerase/epimerase [Lachnospiraceae bacterium]|nr:sugar phosphate isomerase/epimerase [Lachnospiraceae bacterium]